LKSIIVTFSGFNDVTLVSIGSSPCPITSVTYDIIMCVTLSHDVGAANVTVSVCGCDSDDMIVEMTDEYEYRTPLATVDSVSLTMLSVAGGNCIKGPV